MRGVFLDFESVDNGDLDRATLAACLSRWDWHDFTPPTEVSARIAGADVVVANKCPLDRQSLTANFRTAPGPRGCSTRGILPRSAAACGHHGLFWTGRRRKRTTRADQVRQAILSGDEETARELTANLLGSGYYEPGFIRTCRQYEFCQGGG